VRSHSRRNTNHLSALRGRLCFCRRSTAGVKPSQQLQQSRVERAQRKALFDGPRN
jgi:hypothetical protein